MDWIQILSWISVAVVLTALQLSAKKGPIEHPFGVLAAAMVGALVGGNFAHMFLLSSLDVAGYDVGALAGAALLAELAIVVVLTLRPQKRPLPR